MPCGSFGDPVIATRTVRTGDAELCDAAGLGVESDAGRGRLSAAAERRAHRRPSPALQRRLEPRQVRYRVLPSFTEFYRVLLGLTTCCWVLKGDGKIRLG